MPAYAARDELQVDSGENGPGGPDSGVVPAMFDVRLAVCCHEVIIETAAPSRKRIACIACMRQANGHRMPEGLPATGPGAGSRAGARRQNGLLRRRGRPIFGWYFSTLLCRIPRLSDGSLALPHGGANAFWRLHVGPGAHHTTIPESDMSRPLVPSTAGGEPGPNADFSTAYNNSWR